MFKRPSDTRLAEAFLQHVRGDHRLEPMTQAAAGELIGLKQTGISLWEQKLGRGEEIHMKEAAVRRAVVAYLRDEGALDELLSRPSEAETKAQAKRAGRLAEKLAAQKKKKK